MQATQELRSKVTFQPNVATIVSLDYGCEGKETQSRINGATQWQYSVHIDDAPAIFWADAELASAIRATGARGGQTIAIMRKETRIGTRKSAAWVAELVTAEPEPTQEDMASRAWQENEARKRAAQAQAPPPAANARAEEISREADMLQAMRAAIRCARAAAAYAAEQGITLEWSAGDVRAIAATLVSGSRDRRQA